MWERGGIYHKELAYAIVGLARQIWESVVQAVRKGRLENLEQSRCCSSQAGCSYSGSFSFALKTVQLTGQSHATECEDNLHLQPMK